MRVPPNTTFAKKVALEILTIAMQHKERNKPLPDFRKFIIELNTTPLAEEYAEGVFRASSGGYITSILEILKKERLLEMQKLPSQSNLTGKKHVYEITPKGEKVLEDPEKLVMPLPKPRGRRSSKENDSSALEL